MSESWAQYLPFVIVAALLARRALVARQARKRVPELLAQGAAVVDVRSPAEYAAGSAPGSTNIPLERVLSGKDGLDAARPVIVCCASGARSGMAAAALRKRGFKSVLNAGPWTAVRQR